MTSTWGWQFHKRQAEWIAGEVGQLVMADLYDHYSVDVVNELKQHMLWPKRAAQALVASLDLLCQVSRGFLFFPRSLP